MIVVFISLILFFISRCFSFTRASFDPFLLNVVIVVFFLSPSLRRLLHRLCHHHHPIPRHHHHHPYHHSRILSSASTVFLVYVIITIFPSLYPSPLSLPSSSSSFISCSSHPCPRHQHHHHRHTSLTSFLFTKRELHVNIWGPEWRDGGREAPPVPCVYRASSGLSWQSPEANTCEGALCGWVEGVRVLGGKRRFIGGKLA